MTNENPPEENRPLSKCKQCGREITQDYFCHLCYGSAAVQLINRFRETYTNDEIGYKIEKIEERLKIIENILEEIKENVKRKG